MALHPREVWLVDVWRMLSFLALLQAKKKPVPPKWHADLESFEGDINARLHRENLPSMAVLFPLRWRQFHAVAMEQLGGLRKRAGFTPPALDAQDSCIGRVAGPTREKSLKEFGRPTPFSNIELVDVLQLTIPSLLQALRTHLMAAN